MEKKEMNRNLENAIERAAKAEAVLYAADKMLLGLSVNGEDLVEAGHIQNTIAVAQDIIKALRSDLDKLSGDSAVVDVIRAVRENIESRC